AVSDDVILDANVDFARDHSAINDFVFGSIGAEADDAYGPWASHAGDLQQLVNRCQVDIDASIWSDLPRWRCSRRILRLPSNLDDKCKRQQADCNRGTSRRGHSSILAHPLSPSIFRFDGGS